MANGGNGSIGGSYQIANAPPKHRLIVAVDGMEKSGKTNFALTAPGEIAYQSLDIGTEGVIDKFQTQKTIHLAQYRCLTEKGDTPEITMKKALPIWETFLDDFRKVTIPRMKTGQVRTTVWDTGSEIWELQRLARLGKLTQVLPHHYTALNVEYQNLLKEVYLDTPGNLIILHRLKAEWKNDATGKGTKTGLYERKGFAETGFAVQVNAATWRDPKTGTFHLTVKDCRQNEKLMGLDLTDEMATFPWLGVHVFPDSDLSDWGG